MTRLIRPALLLGSALLASTIPQFASAATAEEQILARLNALERENNALRARINRLEGAKATRPPARGSEANPALSALPSRPAAEAFEKSPVMATSVRSTRGTEISGSLLFLQTTPGNLEYGILTNPLPAVSPHWNSHTLDPAFAPAFDVGARYFWGANDIAVKWVHQNRTTNDGFVGAPDQMAGPPYLIGPESAAYKVGSGTVQSRYDSVKLDAGHTFCFGCDFQLRVFGGVEFARLGQDLTGTFQSYSGDASHSYTNTSRFTGAGPRLGVRGQYGLGSFDFSGEVAASALIGTAQSRVNYLTIKPALAEPTVQYLASPNETRVIPSVDARLAAAYSFAPTAYGQLKLEVGYQAAVYFNAVSDYAVTQVPTSLVLPPNGIYLATAQHSYNNFTTHGPFMTAKWRFE
ncbi:MAG: Lpg1974 family pore-forming outer membrane protein [Pseudorhodoplanes sp.]